MANVTKAERHNRNLNNVFNHYREHQKSIPCEHLLNRHCEIAQEKLGITIEEARAKYGFYTVQQWEQFLKLCWNK